MRILICPDSFKLALSAEQVAKTIEQGLHRGFKKPGLLTSCFPLSDGGDGFLSVLSHYYPDIQRYTQPVHNPIGERILAQYAYIPSEDAYVLEFAEVAGLSTVPQDRRRTLTASSIGLGELIQHICSQKQSGQLWIGLGGSATSDGGIGALNQLGFRFLDAKGIPVPSNGSGLFAIDRIVYPDALITAGWSLTLLCDVNNPLAGEKGALFYSQQKGLLPGDKKQLRAGFLRYADRLTAIDGRPWQTAPFGGASGGAAAGLSALLGARCVSGSSWMIQKQDLASVIRDSDILIIAEGRLDEQSFMGKISGKLAHMAKEQQKPVIALCGQIELTWEKRCTAGIDLAFAIQPGPVSMKKALSNSERYLAETATQVGWILSRFH